MRFVVTADTDVGTSKRTNQDSVLVKHAATELGEVVMAIVCDGMGGLSKGELASATVIRAFSQWFDEELPLELKHLDMQIVASKWCLLLKTLNAKIQAYSASIQGESMGTTFSGILLVGGEYLIVHVGDSRVYHISSALVQLTTDQTFVAREVMRGNMTLEQARTDKRRNMLLQCVGASKVVNPQVMLGRVEKGIYMLCSDGFRHEVTDQEMYEAFRPGTLVDKSAMRSNTRHLMELVKRRGERDNISVILVKAEWGE